MFDRVGLDYQTFMVKYGSTRKPTLVKAYVCLFISLSIKAVHLELESDLTTEAFIAALRRFIAHRGKPSLIWSDHGTNFVGAVSELKLSSPFSKIKGRALISGKYFIIICMRNRTNFHETTPLDPTPPGRNLNKAPFQNFVLYRISPGNSFLNVPRTWWIVGGVGYVHEDSSETLSRRNEFMTVLTQVEACLNSRPLVPIPCDGDIMEPLIP